MADGSRVTFGRYFCGRAGKRNRRDQPSTLLQFALEDYTTLHNEVEHLFVITEYRDVFQRVAINQKYIRMSTFFNLTDDSRIGTPGAGKLGQFPGEGGRLRENFCGGEPFRPLHKFTVLICTGFGVDNNVRTKEVNALPNEDVKAGEHGNKFTCSRV